jgi:hypothetical protein
MIGALLPDRIHIEVSSQKKPLAGLLVLTRIVMEEQNDYFGIFGPTDDLGFLTITKDQLLGTAAVTRSFYAAEYADPLTSFAGLVEVRMLDEPGITRALEAHDELTEYPYAEGYYAMLTTARRALVEMGRVLMEVLVTAEGGTSEVKAEVPL